MSWFTELFKNMKVSIIEKVVLYSIIALCLLCLVVLYKAYADTYGDSVFVTIENLKTKDNILLCVQYKDKDGMDKFDCEKKELKKVLKCLGFENLIPKPSPTPTPTYDWNNTPKE
ncbi:MAG: hypothetical protein GY861_00975 [bacterium]|nr:hypothetical protein [bacterium]